MILAVISGGGPTPRQVQPTASGSSTDGRRFERPDTWSDYRPAFHLTPEANWMNDPQRPFYLDGLWHYYYLYNADYPNGNGTEWHHSTSTDLVHWKDEGVAIEKYRNGLGDIETGSAVVDVNNTAGFGAGAVIAVMTQQVDGVQRQSLFSSTDGGYTFASYSANPVMENPGTTDFRDPKIIWDDSHHEWVMVLAEGNKLGFYTSPDLKSWAYTSGFERSDLGTLECPDLFRCRSTVIRRAPAGCSRPAPTDRTTTRARGSPTGRASGTAARSPPTPTLRSGWTAEPTSTRRSRGMTRAKLRQSGSAAAPRSAG